MTADYNADSTQDIAIVRPRVIASVAVVGVILGLLNWGLTELITRLIIGPFFCGGNDCSLNNSLANNIATLLVATAGLFALVRVHTFRPLLVVLMSVITLWGLGTWLGGLAWYEVMLWSGLLYGLSYATFAWLTQIRSFVIALIVCVLLVIAARVLPIL